MGRKALEKLDNRISTSVSTRVQNPELIRKKHLLIARKAAKLFIRKGYDNTSMREISRATNMAVGNLYDYIEKKEDVLVLIFEVYHRNLEESSFFNQMDFKENEDPIESLKKFLYSSLRMIHSFRNEIVLMYRESKRLPKPILKEAMERELRQIEILEKFLRKGMETGIFKIRDPYFTANMLFFQQIIGTLRFWTFRERYTIEELHDLIVESIIASLMNDPR